MVTRRGFEPLNAAVKGRCVKPLHQRAAAGAPDRNRTCDLILTKDALYRLSYRSRLACLHAYDITRQNNEDMRDAPIILRYFIIKIKGSKHYTLKTE